MNTDLKILNKILTKKMQKYIKRIRHQDQVRCSLGMQEWFKVQKLINAICHINRLKKETHDHINAEKEFDKIQQPFSIKIIN